MTATATYVAQATRITNTGMRELRRMYAVAPPVGTVAAVIGVPEAVAGWLPCGVETRVRNKLVDGVTVVYRELRLAR